MCGILGLGLAPECVVETGIHVGGLIFGVVLLLVGVVIAARGAPKAGLVAVLGGALVIILTR
jgi:hypothetical protein